jgi:hypothetical protein
VEGKPFDVIFTIIVSLLFVRALAGQLEGEQQPAAAMTMTRKVIKALLGNGN